MRVRTLARVPVHVHTVLAAAPAPAGAVRVPAEIVAAFVCADVAVAVERADVDVGKQSGRWAANAQAPCPSPYSHLFVDVDVVVHRRHRHQGEPTARTAAKCDQHQHDQHDPRVCPLLLLLLLMLLFSTCVLLMLLFWLLMLLLVLSTQLQAQKAELQGQTKAMASVNAHVGVNVRAVTAEEWPCGEALTMLLVLTPLMLMLTLKLGQQPTQKQGSKASVVLSLQKQLKPTSEVTGQNRNVSAVASFERFGETAQFVITTTTAIVSAFCPVCSPCHPLLSSLPLSACLSLSPPMMIAFSWPSILLLILIACFSATAAARASADPLDRASQDLRVCV